MIDGWGRGIADRLTTKHEYLQVIGRFDDIGAALRGFTGHILLGRPDNWPAHVAGHPPGATLTFVLLDRIGLGGGAWAGVWCIVLGGSAVAAALIAVRALADERLARRAAPFLVLAPMAVWTGASADGYFAAVAAWSVALLALAATRTAPALAGGGRPRFRAALRPDLLPLVRSDARRAAARHRPPADPHGPPRPPLPSRGARRPGRRSPWRGSTGGRGTGCWSSGTTRGRAGSARTPTGSGRTSRRPRSPPDSPRSPVCAGPRPAHRRSVRALRTGTASARTG